jgi:UDP-glucuronate decarboxylase
MNILIAGGAGFIGSNLCKKLLHEGHNVTCIDSLMTGSISNLNECLNNKNFSFILHDITYPIMIDYNIDQIYHLACPASPPKYQKDPLFTSKINFIGTWNLLEFAVKKQAKILLASTSEVYGDPEITPQNESYRGNVNTIGIRSCYDEGKRIAETLFMDFHRTYNIDISIVRIFNTYGPYMDKNDGRVVSNFINQMLSGDNITIYGDGSQTRSFCYIDDLLEGIVKLMNTNYIYPVNIGNNNEITIKELCFILKELIHTESEIVFKPLPNDDPTQRCPDLTTSNNILSWSPIVDLKTGLLKTIQYFSNLN